LWLEKKSDCWLRSGDSLFKTSLSITRGEASFVGGGEVGEMFGV
jgi:hypothetical protein